MVNKNKYKRKGKFNFFNCSLLVIFAIMIFGFSTTVYAELEVGMSANATSDVNGSGNGSGGGNTYAALDFGVRITAVREDTGEIWPGTSPIDFWFGADDGAYITHSMDNKYIRQKVLKAVQSRWLCHDNGGDNVCKTKKADGYDLGYSAHSGGYSQTKFNNFGMGNVSNNTGSVLKIIQHIYDESKQKKYEPLNELMQLLKVKHNKGAGEQVVVAGDDGETGRKILQKDADMLQNLVFQFEPLVVIRNRIDGSVNFIFAGTSSEYAYYTFVYGGKFSGAPNDIGNILFNCSGRGADHNLEGVYSKESHARLGGTGPLASSCVNVWSTDNRNNSRPPGAFLIWTQAHSTGFLTIKDLFVPEEICDDDLQELLNEVNTDADKNITGDYATTKLNEIYNKYKAKGYNYNLLIEWQKYEGNTFTFNGKETTIDGPLCAHYELTGCEARLDAIITKWTKYYQEQYESYKNCYQYNGRYYKHYVQIHPGYGNDYYYSNYYYNYWNYYYRYYYNYRYSYGYDSVYDPRTGRIYYERCQVNSYVQEADKMDLIYSLAMDELQTLKNDFPSFALLTDWKEYAGQVTEDGKEITGPMCEPAPPKKCIPDNDLHWIDECDTGESFFQDDYDPDIWRDCEIAFDAGGTRYSSDNTGHVAIDATYETTNGGIVGNYDYCEVFCHESIRTKFPTHVKGVKAGQTFTWGSSNGVFGTVEIKKECSNQEYEYGKKGYRFEEWKEDYLANEKELVRHYMKKASYEKMLSKITTSSSGNCTCCDCCYTCCSTDKDGNESCSTCCPNNCKYSGSARAPGDNHSWTHSAAQNTINVGSVTGSVSSQSASAGGCYDSPAAAEAAAKANLISKLNSLASGEHASYTGRISQEKELLKKIRQCTSNIKYVYETSIRFIFKEPVNSVYGPNTRSFSYDDFLDVNGSFTEKNVNTSKCKDVKAYSYTCSGFAGGAKCSATLQMVRDCEIVTWDISGTYQHTYPMEDFQWYSLKTDSTLVNKKNKGPEDESFFYYIGFGLPTAFSLTNGTYELKAVVSKIGDAGQTQAIKNDPNDGIVDYNTENGHFWPKGNKLSTGDGYGFEYICTYEVENEMFGYDCRYNADGKLIYNSPAYCDDDEDDDSDGSLVGIDVAYRLVTLIGTKDSVSVAFPGVNGYGRMRGSNWNLPTNTIREILDESIYTRDSKGMYEIMLDVNAINLIRESNEVYFNAGKDPYTSYYDENNTVKVYCASDSSGNQKYCASDFISELYNGLGLNYRLLGTCLPTSNTKKRAEYILENGCDTNYKYPDINWMR